MHDPNAATPSNAAAPSAHIRRATLDDVDALAHHRVEMFRAMGILAAEHAESMRIASANYFGGAMTRGEYHAWVAAPDHDASRVVAGAGIRIDQILPRPGPQGPYLGPDGMLLNVYTEPEWRGRGLASRLVREILDWAIARNFHRVNLHASDDGRSVYERMGFVPTNEMRFTVPARPSTTE